MEAAVYLQPHRTHGAAALPLPLPLPPAHHRALPPLRRHSSSAPPKAAPPAARLTVSARPQSPTRSAPPPPLGAPAAVTHRSSSRAATGYAAALADACVRAGTLRRAARHARAVLSRGHRPLPSPEEDEEEAVASVGQLDARVAALLRMLVRKGRAGMVAEVLAEFAAICDHLLPRARHAC